jgi:para-nitrobenzyl esterase
VPSAVIHAVQWNPVAVMSTDPGAWTHPHSPYVLILDGDCSTSGARWRWAAPGPGDRFDLRATPDESRIFTAGQDPADPVRVAGSVGLDAAARGYRRACPGITDADLSTLMASDSTFRMPARWCARAHEDTGGLRLGGRPSLGYLPRPGERGIAGRARRRRSTGSKSFHSAVTS